MNKTIEKKEFINLFLKLNLIKINNLFKKQI
jgi:hypothetical protein